MERVNFQKGTIVSFLWQDSAFKAGWQRGIDLEGELCHIDTLGYVVGNTEACLTVSTSMDKDNGSAMSPFSVPWSAIVTIEEVHL